MLDRYLEFTHSPLGRSVADALGLPRPPRLYRAGDAAYVSRPFESRGVLLGGSSAAALSAPLLRALDATGATVYIAPEHPGLAPIKRAAAGEVVLRSEPGAEARSEAPFAYVFDATGMSGTAELREVYDFFQPRIGRLPADGRVLILVRTPADAGSPEAAAASAALRGFVRSLGKEVGKRGVTVNLLEVGKHADAWLEGPLRFLLSEHAAYVDGQSLTLGAPPRGFAAPKTFEGTLSGKIAVVTGAARGIGAAIVTTLAREGATVVGIDRPQEEGPLGLTLSPIAGVGLTLDITAANAPARIAQELESRYGGADIVVHNAGITRDKTLKNMRPEHWDAVLDVNLGAILRINQTLLERGLRDGARLVCISSIGGISGNAGQTNYGATKAAIIGYVEALAPVLAARGGAINAVAPGYIETQMTAAMPAIPREVGRRLSALSQGGLPIDIAEAVTFFASPLSAAVNGRTLRVCGQNFMGA